MAKLGGDKSWCGGKVACWSTKATSLKKRVEESYYRGPEELINALAGGTIADSLRPALT